MLQSVELNDSRPYYDLSSGHVVQCMAGMRHIQEKLEQLILNDYTERDDSPGKPAIPVALFLISSLRCNSASP